MDLILPEQATRLRIQFEDESVDQPPLVKLFCHAINCGRTSAGS
ncbi:hypothetical protein [Parvularcula sp. LCG005]|nr:hypothetical protein [Parvularcula sp. LCG005]WOI52219.1 hypothetical protein RUI03_08640 [Parvularcula sp. LCG005]